MKRILAFLTFLIISAPLWATTSTYKTPTAVEFYFSNQSLVATGYISTTFYNATDYQALDFKINAASSGTISTANVIWKNPAGDTLFTETLRSGVPISKMLSNIVTVQILPQSGSTIKVTGNIVLTQKTQDLKRKVRADLLLAVGTTSTTFTVSKANAGYWFIRAPQKVYVSVSGDTATSSKFYLNQDDAVDLGCYLSAGDVVKMIAATTTCNVVGFSRE